MNPLLEGCRFELVPADKEFLGGTMCDAYPRWMFGETFPRFFAGPALLKARAKAEEESYTRLISPIELMWVEAHADPPIVRDLAIEYCATQNTTLASLALLPMIERLSISDAYTVVGKEALQSLRQLRVLSFDYCWALASLDELGELPLLERLGIMGQSGRPEWGDGVGLPALREAIFSGGTAPSGRWFDKLDRLSLSAPYSAGVSPEGLSGSDRLRKLHLRDCIYSHDLDFVHRFPSLAELDFEGGRHALNLAPLASLPQLETLTICTWRAPLEKYETLGELSKLRALTLSHVSLNERALAVLEALPIPSIELENVRLGEQLIEREHLRNSSRLILRRS